MQQPVCLFAARSAEEVAVELDHRRVLVRAAVLRLPVQPVEPAAAARAVRHLLVPIVGFDIDGLPAPAHAAGRAGHHLDKVILFLTFFERLDEAAGLPGAPGHRHLQAQIPHLYLGVLVLVRAHLGEFDILELLPGNPLVGGAQGRLHDPAGGAEDDPRAAGRAQRVVELLFRQLAQVDTGLEKHLGKLAGGQFGVHVAVAAVVHLRAQQLVFFGDAGHDRDNKDPRRVDPRFAGVVGLGQRAEDLLRRLDLGKIFRIFGVEELAEADPAGAAGGELGEGAAPLQPFDQLGGLLHYGDIGAEAVVENAVEAQPPQRGDHLPGHRGAHGVAEFLTDGAADGRSGLDDDVEMGIAQRLPDPRRRVLLVQRSRGADGDALAAVDAGGLHERAVVGRADDGIERALHHAVDPHRLVVLADRQAAPAADAFVGLAHHRGGKIVDGEVVAAAFDEDVPDPVALGQPLQLAVEVALAGKAFKGVIGQKQLDHLLARGEHLRGVGPDAHPFAHRKHAGGVHGRPSLHLHQADPAGGGGV